MDDFSLITEEDKEDLAYGACVAAAGLTGMAVGRLLGLQGLLAGAAAGVLYGLVACRHLKEPIKQKLFSGGGALTDPELAEALRAVRLETGVATKSDAMVLLAAAREASGSANASPKKPPMTARVAARVLLDERAASPGAGAG